MTVAITPQQRLGVQLRVYRSRCGAGGWDCLVVTGARPVVKRS